MKCIKCGSSGSMYEGNGFGCDHVGMDCKQAHDYHVEGLVARDNHIKALEESAKGLVKKAEEICKVASAYSDGDNADLETLIDDFRGSVAAYHAQAGGGK